MLDAKTSVKRVAVMGWGDFGRAIGSLLEYNGVAFSPVDVGMPLTHDVDVLFQMVPAQFIGDAFRTNSEYIKPGTIIVNGAKGIEKDTHHLPWQIIEEVGPFTSYCSLVGPSFANGITAKHPTLVSLGYRAKKPAETVKNLLQTPYFRLQLTEDYQSLELASALKNVYAIVCGYVDGLGYGQNTRAKLIALALQEVAKLGEAAQGKPIDVLVPGVAGDLILTCSSPESRNYRFGTYLASMDSAAAQKKLGATVEGLHTSDSIQALARKYHVTLPVAMLTHRIVDGAAGRHEFEQFVATL